MSNLNVTYAELDATANQLQQGQGDLEQILGHLQQLVANLVSSGFVTDAASGAFQQSYDDFTTGAKQTVAGLEGMAQFLKTSAQTLSDVDAQLAQGIRG
ncbi:WXG100 family type VII secretion target [Xylanimonas ulmi]|uniref:WXG100 family type VII secretion target n=1 Tax=Xylanimonas ulmi TaxID=228973 RepID=A0A4Q7M571_9MICO|nr:WXG100 family type VII secretion target [Xylanibacterium ulmi]RZS63106.1 WXG100 family type VII secretion target [Xylanibacterium ulmi]